MRCARILYIETRDSTHRENLMQTITLKLTPARKRVLMHLIEFVFLYHTDEDRHVATDAVLRGMAEADILFKHTKATHDFPCYELSDAGDRYVMENIAWDDLSDSLQTAYPEYNPNKVEA